MKGAKGERALGTSKRYSIPLGVALSGLGDAIDVGELDGERLVEVKIAASRAFLLEEGESANPVRVVGGALDPADEVAEAAEVDILDGIALRCASVVTGRDGFVVLAGDVWMRYSTQGTPERGVLDGVLV